MSVAPRFLAPEVIQSSAMDCGPASLKCLLEGFGVPVSYGRLREACQTDVDGTTIDTIEEVAVQLGLDAEQVILPLEHVLLPEARNLPALVVVMLPDGMTHFVVAWRRVGPFVQVMDPGSGRSWVRVQRFQDQLYRHPMPVPAAEWRDWAGGEEFLVPLQARLRALGLSEAAARQRIEAATADPGWHALASLDATTRMVTELVQGGGLRRGAEAEGALDALLVEVRAEDPATPATVPPLYWSARGRPPQEGEEEEQLVLRGAVAVRVRGPRQAEQDEDRPELPPDLVAALTRPDPPAWKELWRLVRDEGPRAPALLVGAVAAAAGAVLVEALLFRALFEVGRLLAPPEQRAMGLVAVVVFAVGLLLLELGIGSAALRLGRHLELRMRAAFLRKIPRLGDRYFQSRLTSDMAERAHSVRILRVLPELSARMLQALAGLLFTVIGIGWLEPRLLLPALVAAVLAVMVPLLVHPLLAERELRQRTHGGGLTSLYLDAMLGLVAVRTHRAERAIRRQHEHLLTEWSRAGLDLQRAAVLAEGAQAALGFVLAAGLLGAHLSLSGGAGAALLLAYWALQVPALGQELAVSLRQYPASRNAALRLLEPLGAPEEGSDAVEEGPAREGPVSIELDGVTVVAAGHTILEGIDLQVRPGEHVGIVGSSGAGKSSLVGLLLGWHRPAAGQLRVDGQPLEGEALVALRRRTAWVDPDVHLWNRAFLDNLLYGSRPDDGAPPVAAALQAADLRGVLEELPEGLQSALGEGGGLLSGGQGQRVRLGRALLRPGAGLVVLDEPFRGLDRDKRRALLEQARSWWSDSTLLCITHDVGDTRGFSRVVVVEGGRIVEDGAPEALLADEGSRYRALVEAEEAVRRSLWEGAGWRRLWLEKGRLREGVEG